MSDKAIVKEILSENRAIVLKLPEAREHKNCAKCGSCGASDRAIETIALNSLDAKPGDLVSIETDESKSIWLLFILIGSPIFLPLIFYLIGSALGLPDAGSGVMAAFGLFSAYKIIKFHNNKAANGPPITTITEIQRDENDVQQTENQLNT